MHILLTGAAGRLGLYTLLYLLEQGHQVTSLDVDPLPEATSQQIKGNHVHHVIDTTNYQLIEELFQRSDTIHGVIHLGAIPAPGKHDSRELHNNNVTSSYNILRTAVDHGVKRIVQASSINATGLSFTPEGHQTFDVFPLTEGNTPYRPEDEYALSKQIAEIQAESLVRLVPGVRIASLRFSHILDSYDEAVPHADWKNLWSWVSREACARSCLLGLTSEGWGGAEAFWIIGPQICYEKGRSPKAIPGELSDNVGDGDTLELLNLCWKGRYQEIQKEWWDDNPRKALYDCGKAERLLGWKHDE